MGQRDGKTAAVTSGSTVIALATDERLAAEDAQLGEWTNRAAVGPVDAGIAPDRGLTDGPRLVDAIALWITEVQYPRKLLEQELAEAAAASSALALDNERLRADLQARLEELRRLRVRIVEAGDAARRRIERNLHDGAQQQLVALALDLGLLNARLKDSAIDELSGRLASALAELRELARGIHPAILTDHGLALAIGSLVDRATVPVETVVKLPEDECLPAPVEAAAYFLVAEALTNVARHAEATQAWVQVVLEPEALVVLVADDGVGGVEPSHGAGLRALDDRVATVGGTLEVDSPVGEGTRLHARLPV